MADKKKAKYFCEGCGSEVGANAKFCPKCGKFFAAVRCPSCGHVGTVKNFIHGCPSCHYAMSKEEIYGTQDSEESTLDGREHKLSPKSRKAIKSAFKAKGKKNGGDDIPGWMLAAGLAVLVAVSAVFVIRCTAA